VVASITPGPNNLLLAASGANFGIRRTVPQMAGIDAGCAIVQLVAGLGLGGLLQAFPAFRLGIQIMGAAVTLWLSWKIATAGGFGHGETRGKPIGFWGAVLFQAVNPKLWVITISAMSLFVRPGHIAADVIFMTFLLGLVNIPCMLVWAGFGAGLGDFLRVPSRLRVFNRVMGALLALSTLALLRG
jgi:threonine/homoserine/homoserine lactone efflux protein